MFQNNFRFTGVTNGREFLYTDQSTSSNVEEVQLPKPGIKADKILLSNLCTVF